MTTPARPQQFATVREIADLLRVSTMTVYRAIRDEELRAYRVGRSVRVDRRDLADWLRTKNTIEFERPA